MKYFTTKLQAEREAEKRGSSVKAYRLKTRLYFVGTKDQADQAKQRHGVAQKRPATQPKNKAKYTPKTQMEHHQQPHATLRLQQSRKKEKRSIHTQL